MEQTEEYVNGQLKAKYGDCFIRGNNGNLGLVSTMPVCLCSDRPLFVSSTWPLPARLLWPLQCSTSPRQDVVAEIGIRGWAWVRYTVQIIFGLLGLQQRNTTRALYLAWVLGGASCPILSSLPLAAASPLQEPPPNPQEPAGATGAAKFILKINLGALTRSRFSTKSRAHSPF